MARRHSLTLAAGEVVHLATAGAFITILEGTLRALLVGFDGPPALELEPGLTYRPDRPFRVLSLENPGSVPTTVELVIGGGQLEDRRQISSAADSYEPVTLADARAKGYRTTTTLTPTAGQYMHLQLWNPASSGVLAVIRQLVLWSDTAGRITCRFHASALATLSNEIRSVYAGDADGSVQLRNESSASLVGSGAAVLQVELVANTTVVVPLPTPLILPESQGLVVQRATVTASLGMSPDVLEIPG